MAKISDLLPEGGILPDAPAVKTSGELKFGTGVPLQHGNNAEIDNVWENDKFRTKSSLADNRGIVPDPTFQENFHGENGETAGWRFRSCRATREADGVSVEHTDVANQYGESNSGTIDHVDPGLRFQQGLSYRVVIEVDEITVDKAYFHKPSTQAYYRDKFEDHPDLVELTPGLNVIEFVATCVGIFTITLHSAVAGGKIKLTNVDVFRGDLFGSEIETIEVENNVKRFRQDIVASRFNGYGTDDFRSGALHDYIDLVVNGDADTYYPVLVYAGYAGYGFHRTNIGRGYAWHAPDSWNGSSTHRGGLTFTYESIGGTSWDGNNHNYRVREFHQSYSTMVAGMTLSVLGMVVWLRGGGATYRITSQVGVAQKVVIGDTVDGITMPEPDGTQYLPRNDDTLVSSEIHSRWPIRGNGAEGSIFDNNERVYSPHNKPTPNDIGALSKTHHDITTYRLGAYRGIHGGYGGAGDESGTGDAWGAPIWSMGDGYDGSSSAGLSHTVGNYQVAWLRTSHPSALPTVGEGMYVFRAGVLVFASGHLGTYSNKSVNIPVDQKLNLGTTEFYEGGNGNVHLDVNTGGNVVLRDGNSSNATRFTFDIDTGYFYATKYYEGGVDLDTKYLRRTGTDVKTMSGALKITGGGSNVGDNDGAYLDIDHRANSGSAVGVRIKIDGDAGSSSGGDWFIDCWGNSDGPSTTIADRKFAIDGMGNLILNGTFEWNGVKYSDFSGLTVNYAQNANLLDNLNSSQFLRSDTADYMAGELETIAGIHGGYGNNRGSGSNWGSTIWGMGSSYNGGSGGTSYTVPTYGICWLRGSHASASSIVGEGAYLYQSSGLRHAHGSAGMYQAGQIYATSNITAYYSDGRLKTKIRDLDPEESLKVVVGSIKMFYRANALAHKLSDGEFDPNKVEVGLDASQFVGTEYECLTPLAPFDIDHETGKSKSGENYRTFDYGRYTTLVASSIEALAERDAIKEQRISELEDEVADLKRMIIELINSK